MAGETHTKLAVGDRCIIHVNDVSRTTGWWWGVVDSFEWQDSGWGRVTARITGPFGFEPWNAGIWKPLYGDAAIMPSVNYTVYGADRDTVDLVHRLVQAERMETAELRRLRAVNAELRDLFKSLAVSPDTITDAVRAAMREGVS